MKTSAGAVLLIFSASAFAQDMPVPKMFRGMQGQKGQYQVEFLEGGGRANKAAPTMTVCTDNLMNASKGGGDQPRAEPGCKHQLLKDTAEEAVVETTCPERKSTVTMKREGKSMLMTVESSGARGPQTMKMRYTHLGACREGQGMVTDGQGQRAVQEDQGAGGEDGPGQAVRAQQGPRHVRAARARGRRAALGDVRLAHEVVFRRGSACRMY